MAGDQLSKMKVAIIATDGFEEAELTEPLNALRQAGAHVDVIAPHGGTIQAVKHDTKSQRIPVDRTLDKVTPDQYDALQLPGGALNADALRMDQQARRFIEAFASEGKPMAVICHAPWELISAGVARGRTLTSYYTIQDDLRNAGANWVDKEVVVDGNLVTSRKPDDIPAFNREMINLFASRQPQGAAR